MVVNDVAGKIPATSLSKHFAKNVFIVSASAVNY